MQIGFTLGGVLWAGSAAISAYFAYKRNITAHRKWVILMTALGLGAFTIRFQIQVFEGWVGLPHDTSVSISAWA